MGELPERASRRVHRPVDLGAVARLRPGRVRAGRARRLHAASDAQHPTGQTVMAFAGWQGDTIGYLACGIRPMYLADLNFEPSASPPAPS